jgi:O-methyltransferase involved in polyketide biosynthesis
VPVDFEHASWRHEVAAAGFDQRRRAVVASTGVSMYLTAEANRSVLHQVSDLATGSTFAMTFMVPTDLLDEQDLAARQGAERGARAGGTPFLSYYSPQDMLALAKDADFDSARIVSSSDLAIRYFAGRNDGLSPASAEAILVATT